MDTATTRRDFLKTVGLLTIVGSADLAGCITQANESQPTGPRLLNEPNYKGFLDETDNYSHTLDWREKDAITIEVGSEANMAPTGSVPRQSRSHPHESNVGVEWLWWHSQRCGYPGDVQQRRAGQRGRHALRVYFRSAWHVRLRV